MRSSKLVGCFLSRHRYSPPIWLSAMIGLLRLYFAERRIQYNGAAEAEKLGFKILADLVGKKIPSPHNAVITSKGCCTRSEMRWMRVGRATIEAIHYFKNNKAQSTAILKKMPRAILQRSTPRTAI